MSEHRFCAEINEVNCIVLIASGVAVESFHTKQNFSFMARLPMPRQRFVNIAPTHRAAIGLDQADQHGTESKCLVGLMVFAGLQADGGFGE